MTSIEVFYNELSKNGIVITDEQSDITAMLFNTKNLKRNNYDIYNIILLYKIVCEIDKGASTRLIINLKRGFYDEFDKEKIEEYENAKTVIILNENDLLYKKIKK
jgi:hypothetical protein